MIGIDQQRSQAHQAMVDAVMVTVMNEIDLSFPYYLVVERNNQ